MHELSTNYLDLKCMKAGSVLFNVGLTLYSVSLRTRQERVGEEEEEYLEEKVVGGVVGGGSPPVGRHQPGDFKVESQFPNRSHSSLLNILPLKKVWKSWNNRCTVQQFWQLLTLFLMLTLLILLTSWHCWHYLNDKSLSIFSPRLWVNFDFSCWMRKMISCEAETQIGLHFESSPQCTFEPAPPLLFNQFSLRRFKFQ